MIDELTQMISTWSEVTTAPHRFGGIEFLVGKTEIGHIHRGGWVDIPFSRAIRDQLIAEGKAMLHHILPDTGWVSYWMHHEDDLQHVLWLFHLSYLQKQLRKTRELTPELRQQLKALNLSPELDALLTTRYDTATL